MEAFLGLELLTDAAVQAIVSDDQNKLHGERTHCTQYHAQPRIVDSATRVDYEARGPKRFLVASAFVNGSGQSTHDAAVPPALPNVVGSVFPRTSRPGAEQQSRRGRV